ncbi:PLxRFG domain-containing protein [Acinetobacter tianfuensis]|uniref:PLxRFG domain-containing protein n=1 Tax=Acinetobacter tianfuensis TaxID=2419603 RepID=A0A3A8EGN3_9GAMM|nr:PLxRFG domain-containing protein [Acinetobacter tianfuensis]RKG33725.1 PLxRFG domain-containing protein [Acinetobacter tianfuensis]
MSEQKKPWEQNWNQPTANNSDSTNKKPWEQNWSEEKTDRPKDKGFLGHLKDTGLSALKGAVAVPELAVGIMDVMSDGATGKILENKNGTVGFRPKEAKQALGDLHTDQYKAQQQEFADAGKDGNWVDKVVDKTKVALTNPSLIANTVVESVPSMLAGGVLGRASGIANPVVAGAVGEGAVMAGSQAEQIRQETVDGRLTADQSLAGVATGALGGLIGFAGGRLAQKMGIGDVDTMLVTGRAGPAEIAGEIASMPAKSLPRRVIEGAISEGFLEELPQSVSEQVIQNLALDKPWHDGIEDAAVMGTLAGMAMGGAANILPSHNTGTESQDNQQQSGSPNLPSAPPQSGSNPNSAMTGEYIPRGNAPQGDNQGRTAFVYDQPSMDADNLLNNNGFDYGSAATGNPVSPDTPPAPNGNYFDGDYGSEAAFDDLLNSVPPASQTPSQQMGINPNDGPMSSAAALAVDTGVSSQMQQAVAAAAQNENNNSPLTTAAGLLNAPNENSSSNESGTGSSSNGPLGETSNSQLRETSRSISTVANSNADDSKDNNLERPGDTALLSNTIGNDGKDTSGRNDSVNSVSGIGEPSQAAPGQPDRNNLNTVGNNSVLSGENEAAATSSSTIGTTAGDSQNRTVEPILGADGKNKWFGNQEKAQAFLDKKNLGNDYQVVQDGKHFEIQPNVAQVQDGNQSQLEALEQQFEEAKTVPEKARIRKEINALQQGDNQPSAIENTISASENNISMPKNTILDAQNNIDKTQTNNVADQLAQLEQQFLDAKSVPQKAKLKKQIDQLKSQQTEMTTTPFSSEQIQKQYGDTAESVMSDIEILGDDFTIDLRDDNKKTNALNNPNYNAVQKADGSVEIVGMKHPTTGEWVGKKPNAMSIDENAHQAATSSQNNTPEPTQAQIEAGNYKKGHIKVHGLDISIENPKGSERRGTDPNGKEWAHTMSDHYGYIKRTTGADQEHIDTYVGKNPESENVFIVDQIDQGSGGFDEHKVMLGFDSQEEAITAYKSNFDKGWKVGPIRTMDMEQFKNWLKNEDTSKPANEIKADSLITQGANVNAKSEQGLNTYTQIQSDSGLTHIIPSILMDQVHKLGSVVNDISSIKTEGIKTNVLYGKQLLAQIAKLKPDVQVHIVSDLNSIKDNTIRANLNAGGFFVPEQNTAYLYPQSRAWESSALELLNHELVHAVTEQSIFAGQVSQSNLNKLNEIIDNIKEYAFENYASLTEHVNDRLDYATTTNPTHEILAVGISETQVRQVLQNILGADGLQQLNSIFTEISTEQENQNEQRKQNGNPREHSKGNTKNVSEPTDGITEEVSGGTTSTETDRNFKRNTSNPSGNLSGNESSQYPFTLNKTIQDFGEKVGGARKDTAVRTGKKSTASKEKDNRPTWAKRYEISEIVASINSEEKGKWIISDTRKKDWKGQNRIVTKQQFNTKEEAEAALPLNAVAQKHRVWSAGKETFAIYREINDRKRVKVVEQEFKTREEAMQYMAIHASEILETNTTFGEIDLPRPENTQRKGIARRTDDAKDSDFTKVFGFRGVEFGNWNNQSERQELLNDAFDGLMDLAEILNIPPAAISLNGELALAFGARGQGLSGAKAHYEPERTVINLTKLNGAGSLAHEWWHALDHYFGRQDGKAPSEWVTNADGSRSLKIAKHFEDMSVTSGFSYKSNVREDVQEAYKQLVQTIFRKSENYIEDTVKVESFVSSARNNLKDQLDKLRADLNRELDPKYYKRFNKAASAEQLAEFDTVAELLLTGTALTTEIRHNNNKNSRNIFSGARWSNDALDKLSVIYKSVRGRSGFNAEQKGVLDRLRQYMNTYAQRLKLLAEAQNGTEKAKMIPTDFAMNAKELDQGRGTDYWITTPEMTARAFQGYVEDKISQNSGYSPFLNFGPESAAIFTPWGFKRPFPTGTERKAINAKFSDLVDTLKTEETETGIKLYSRDKLKPDNERRGASPLDTTFTPLSVVSATRRVLSILQHLKMSATQDASSRGRINVSLNNRIGVNKVGNVNSNGFSVQVISSFSDLPKVIQNDATYKDENGKTQNYDVSGVWHDGTLYVVADQVYGDSNKQLTTFDAYEELLTHEIVGHFGVQKLFGNEYKTKLQQLYNALGELEGIRKIASKNGVNMAQFESAYIEPYTQGAKEGIYAESDVQQALVGELFAFVAQNAKSRPFVRQKLKEVIGYIRQWFRDRGFDKFLSRYNDADLMMFLSEARKAVVDRSYFGKYKNQEFSSKNNSDTPLYSRLTKSNSGSTTQQVRDVLIDRFGKETIDELERQGKLEIIQDYQVEGVEGFYYNGKAVLVASNLTAESTVPTFLHELGGHAGFQNMMNQKQYNELMNQFNKLVEQGNPVALAAKMLAEREQGSERQQLEYLPYLLTLSSTMQQRNVIQRNALQKLINNIVSYVKAWVFDNFGINLNLNPDDMLALSERMIGQIKHQSSLDLIRQKYHGTNQWMTAPNGAKTHLSEQQWLQVRTPEFKKWFGDWENDAKNASQVLDENGEPKVVYHGTASEFNEFKQGHGILGDGIYLTDSFDTADVYANIRGENGFVLPLFVNIRNAFKTTGNVSRDEFVEATTSGKYQGIVHQFENQEYIVALEPNQVKMAEGNKGTFNSESSDIRFSRSAKDIIDNLSKNLGNISISSVKDKTGYKFTDWLGIGLSALGRRQLTEIYSKILPQLNKYNELAAQMDADKNDAGAEADSVVREWANLNDEDQLAELMHDSTLAKIDPTKPYVKGDSVSRYKQLRDDYNSLSPEAQAMYLKARDAYKKHYAKVHQAIKERILRSELSSQKKADLLKQMDDNFFGYVKGVYFPLARFGKYVVVMRNQNGEVESVSRAETMGEAQSLRSELMQKYPHYKTDRVVLDKEFNASRDAVGRGFMTNLFAEVDNLGLSTAEQAEFEDTLSQLYLSSMPDLSWAKHGIHRKGTAGFSQDARRAFAQNMFHGAGYLAKLRYGDQLAQQLDDMQKYASEQSKLNDSYDQPTAQRVIDEMNKRHDNLMNPKSHPLSSALTSLGFIYYLGLSPAAAMVNLSQTALVAYPLMGAKWGFDKAADELLKASNDFRKGVEFHKVKWEGSKTDLYKTISSDISKFLNKDEKQAYEDAVARGVIDVTQAHDLAGIAQGEDSGVMWKTRPIMRAASVMFHSAERFNREVTFIAAYRLARQSGEKHDSAFDQAVDATYRGHFDYSSGNRPRIMQGNVAKVLLLFKQFGQNMVYTLARQTYQSIKGETEAERKEARKSLAAILAMHATFAGTLGLPMVGMLLSVASWMGGDDDDPWDAEVALRNYLAEAFGPTISNMLMKGAPRGIGVDISGRVGINNLLLPDVQEGLEGKKWWDSASAAVLGPIGGIGANIAKGAQEISEGHNLRGVESMLPVFLKNFAKTYRYADEGVQDKTGVSIMDEVSSMDLLVQGMGFSPSDVRTANEGKTAIYQLNRKLNERRSRLMTLWSRAKMMDDQQEMDEIWDEIQGFNDKNPSRRITRMNLNQSYRNRQRRIDRAEDGIYLSRNRQDAREAGYFAFGE